MQGIKNIKGKFRLFDIASNLTDNHFIGEYHGKKYHECDIDNVIKRASEVGCSHMLIVGGYLEESKTAY